MGLLRAPSAPPKGASLSVDADPRTACPQRLNHLGSLGFDRVSLGVHDFDRAVLAAVPPAVLRLGP